MAALSGPMFSAYGADFGNLTVVDKVLPDMLHLIDPHWRQFPPMNPLWHAILGFVIGVLGVVSICGNMMVLYIFGTTKSLRTPSNLLVINLAFSDFVMMIMMSPPMVINCYYETWVLGPLMCELYAMVGSLCGGVDIWTMTMISLDRYNVIVKGVAGKPLTSGSAMLRILFIWTFAGIWTVLPMLGWNRYIPEGNMTACGTDYLNQDWSSASYLFCYAIFVYVIPLSLICFSYWFILAAVSAHEKSMREQAKKMNVASLRAEDKATSAECKIAKVALVTISLWVTAWTPYLIINMQGIFYGPSLTPLATIWASLFAKASTVYNPIVYGISHPRYRAALYQKFPSLACGPENDEAPATKSQASVETNEKA